MTQPYNTFDESDDPSASEPSAERAIRWEHGQDLRAYLTLSVILNVLFAFSLFVMAVVLMIIYSRPPFVVAQDKGKVYYRTSESFKLRTDIIKSFLTVTTGGLYTFDSSGYDPSGLDHLVDPAVLEAFAREARKQAELRINKKLRQIWVIREIKRYYDPDFSNLLCLAIRGEKANYEFTVTSSQQTDMKTTSMMTLAVAYVEQITPTPDNPWGMRLIGIYEVADPTDAQILWEQCVPLPGSTDSRGRTIRPPEGDELPPP